MQKNQTVKDKSELLKIAYAENTSKRVRKRVLSVSMCLNGIDEEIAAKTLGICDKSVKNYMKKYSEKGLMSLIQEKPYRPESEMEKYATEIVESLENEPCMSLKECCARIEKLTGLKRSKTQVANFIKKKDSDCSKLVKSLQKQIQKNRENF